MLLDIKLHLVTLHYITLNWIELNWIALRIKHKQSANTEHGKQTNKQTKNNPKLKNNKNWNETNERTRKEKEQQTTTRKKKGKMYKWLMINQELYYKYISGDLIETRKKNRERERDIKIYHF